MAREFIEKQDTLNDGREKLNRSITRAYDADAKSDKAVNTSNEAKRTSQTAEEKADSVQNQFNQVVIDGDSSVEAAQARVAADGTTYPVLKERLDTEHEKITTQLDETASNFKSTKEDEQPRISEEELMGGSNWVLGSGWSGNFETGFTHTKGNTEPLTRQMTNLGNNFYQIEITVESPETTKDSNSGWEISIGGSDGFEMYEGNFTEHTYTRTIRSGGGNDLVINPVSNFDGTITNISMRLVTGTTRPTFVIKDSTGENVMEVTSTGADNRNVFIGKGIASYNTTGHRNVAIGDRAFADNSSGFWNVAIGDEAMQDNTVGSRSVAIGHIALRRNTVGHRNIAIGPFSLEQNTTGTNNIAIGVDPMQFGKNTHFNIAFGTSALTRLENGADNIVMGRGVASGLQGNFNIALGRSALVSYSGDGLVGIGAYALLSLQSGTNTAIGFSSLMTGKEMNKNTAVGYETLRRLSDGGRNTVIGHQSAHNLRDGFSNTAIGNETLTNLTTGSTNVAIGSTAGARLTTGSNNILLASDVISEGDSNKMNLGNLIYSDLLTHSTYLGRRREPTAILELREGTGKPGGAPLKFNHASLLSSPEAGTFEFNNGVLYFTGREGQRRKVVLE